jgi:hypothetical protein
MRRAFFCGAPPPSERFLKNGEPAGRAIAPTPSAAPAALRAYNASRSTHALRGFRAIAHRCRTILKEGFWSNYNFRIHIVTILRLYETLPVMKSSYNVAAVP